MEGTREGADPSPPLFLSFPRIASRRRRDDRVGVSPGRGKNFFLLRGCPCFARGRQTPLFDPLSFPIASPPRPFLRVLFGTWFTRAVVTHRNPWYPLSFFIHFLSVLTLWRAARVRWKFGCILEIAYYWKNWGFWKWLRKIVENFWNFWNKESSNSSFFLRWKEKRRFWNFSNILEIIGKIEGTVEKNCGKFLEFLEFLV